MQWYGYMPGVMKRCVNEKGAVCTSEFQASGESGRVVEWPLDCHTHFTVSPTMMVVVSVPLSSSKNVSVPPGPTSTTFVAAGTGTNRTARVSTGTPSKATVSVEPAPESPAPPASSSVTSTPAALATGTVSREGSPSVSGARMTRPGPATIVACAPGGGSVTLSSASTGTSRTGTVAPGPLSGTSTDDRGS